MQASKPKVNNFAGRPVPDMGFPAQGPKKVISRPAQTRVPRAPAMPMPMPGKNQAPGNMAFKKVAPRGKKA